MQNGSKVFFKKRNFLTLNIILSVRKSFLKAFVEIVALYRSETWAINHSGRKRIKTSEMWWYRRMLNIRWMDSITNKVILNRIGKKRSLWHTLTITRDQSIVHIIRHQEIINLALQGSVCGNNCRGRPRDEEACLE